MDLDMNNIGSRIKYRRNELNLTQTDIFNRCGIAPGSLSQIENGIRTPTIIIFYKLAQTLECDMEWLVTGISSSTDNFIIYENEKNLLHDFRILSNEDQEELVEILNMKLRRTQRKRKPDTKSYLSDDTDMDKSVC